MPSTIIARDPFARLELIRQTIPASDREPCHWCGQPGRFQYGYESDSRPGRVNWNPHIYCSVGCYRDDNNLQLDQL